MDLLDWALEHARRGWPVFPLLPRAKQPFPAKSACTHLPHRHGFKDATLDADTIRAWWTDHPDANVGIVTGRASGLLVVDIDPRSGGDVTLAELIALTSRQYTACTGCLQTVMIDILAYYCNTSPQGILMG